MIDTIFVVIIVYVLNYVTNVIHGTYPNGCNRQQIGNAFFAFYRFTSAVGNQDTTELINLNHSDTINLMNKQP